MPKKSLRAGISKSVRFDVFHRDGFRCRYCGKSSEEVTLVIDHVIPVAKGGTNDPSNLTTSCDPCNSGKSAKTILEPPDNEGARLASLQMAREQLAEARAASAAMKAEKKYRQMVVDEWCAITGRPDADRGTISIVVAYAKEFGLDVVVGWMSKAHWKAGHSDKQMGRYISGIKRHYVEERK